MIIKARSLDFIPRGWIGQYDSIYRVVQLFDEKEDPVRFIPVTCEDDAMPGGVVSVNLHKRIGAEKRDT